LDLLGSISDAILAALAAFDRPAARLADGPALVDDSHEGPLRGDTFGPAAFRQNRCR
jgi:hypothetical protein